MIWKDSWLLRNAPRPVKALALGYVMSLSLGYLYALGHLFYAVGWTPKSIAVHYHGAVATPVVEGLGPEQGEVEFTFEESFEEPDLSSAVRPSFKNLVATGHFHLFGMSSFFFGLALLGLFVKCGELCKGFLVLAPFVAIVLDNLSFLVTRFVGPSFAYLTMASGVLMAMSFLGLWCFILREVFSSPEVE